MQIRKGTRIKFTKAVNAWDQDTVYKVKVIWPERVELQKDGVSVSVAREAFIGLGPVLADADDS